MDKNIDYVIAAAECGSISKAADLLFISQPSLSRFLSKLESELGLRLFVRNPDGIELTEAGNVYVSYAKEIKRLQSTMDRKLYQMRMNEQSRRISICMTLNTSSLSTWQITGEFHKKYPECSLEFINVMSRDIQRMLDEQKCDFAIGPDVCDRNLYDYREVISDKVLLLAPRGRYDFDDLAEEREGFPFPWVDLHLVKDVDFVFQETSCNMRQPLDQHLQRMGIVIRPKMELTNSILTIQAAEQQLGCCIISASFLPYIAHREELRYYCVGDEETKTVSGIIRSRDKVLTPQEKYAVSLLKRQILSERQRLHREFMGI